MATRRWELFAQLCQFAFRHAWRSPDRIEIKHDVNTRQPSSKAWPLRYYPAIGGHARQRRGVALMPALQTTGTTSMLIHATST
jgi:hypothetical protein